MWGDFRVAYKRALFAVITSSAALLAASMVPAAAATDLVAVSAPYLLKAGPVGGPVRTVACGLLVADGQRRDSWRERTGRACRPHGGGRRRLRGAEGRTWPVPRLRQEQRLGHLLPRRRPRPGRRERWGPHLRAQRRGNLVEQVWDPGVPFHVDGSRRGTSAPSTGRRARPRSWQAASGRLRSARPSVHRSTASTDGPRALAW